MSTLNYRRGEAIAMALLVVLLVLGALIWPGIGRGRRLEPAGPVGETTRDIAMARPNGPGPYGNNSYDQLPTYGEVNPTRRERSGALR